MVVAEHEAAKFIQGYTQVMVQIYGAVPAKPKMELLEILAAARAKYVADRSLLEVGLRELEAKSKVVPPEVVAAIRSLEVKKWVYLRDTRSHSVFVDPSGEAAFGVLGLTQRIRNVIGGSGAVVETGIVRYAGHYVTDGIVSNLAWLGSNYRKEYSSVVASLRKSGGFHASCAPSLKKHHPSN
ncbi:MAG: hypothetical protein KGZ83_03195 [Sulfuricella sp.]|nr:hypothetical protein [Sulfuricella sp.]